MQSWILMGPRFVEERRWDQIESKSTVITWVNMTRKRDVIQVKVNSINPKRKVMRREKSFFLNIKGKNNLETLFITFHHLSILTLQNLGHPNSHHTTHTHTYIFEPTISSQSSYLGSSHITAFPLTNFIPVLKNMNRKDKNGGKLREYWMTGLRTEFNPLI